MILVSRITCPFELALGLAQKLAHCLDIIGHASHRHQACLWIQDHSTALATTDQMLERGFQILQKLLWLPVSITVPLLLLLLELLELLLLLLLSELSCCRSR